MNQKERPKYILDLFQIDDAYEVVKRFEYKLSEEQRKEVYEYLAKRYQREVIEFLPCSD